ncbi:MAG: hypothetical protein D6681_16015 [Calditrichaeota bacterium]|nr:MAG: hypothetical protein D6681_16015 [Calditrichota bacterium]
MSLWLAVLGMLLVLWGCETQLSREQKQVLEMSRRATLLEKQQTLLEWFYAVEGKVPRMAPTYSDFEDLLSPSTLRLVESVLQRTTEVNRSREILYFKNYLVGKYVDRAVAAYQDSVRKIVASTMFRFGADYYRISDLRELMSTRLLALQHRILSESALPVLERVHRFQDSTRTRREQLGRKLGYGSYMELTAALYNYNPDLLRQLGLAILDQTDSLYAALQQELIARSRHRIPRIPTYRHILALETENDFPQLFPRGLQFARVSRFLRGMGLDPRHQPTLKVDTLRGYRKPMAVFCAPVEPPRDVRLSIRLENSFELQKKIFYALGCAEFAVFNENPSPTFRQLYQSPVQDVFGMLFQNSWLDTGWVGESLDFAEADPRLWTSAAAWAALKEVRLLAAATCYEIDLAGSFRDSLALFGEYMSRALHARLTELEAHYLLFHQPEASVLAKRLEAAVLEPELRRYVENQFSPRWYENPECGNFFKSIWVRGNAWTVPELMNRIGVRELRVEPLIREIGQILDFSPPGDQSPGAAPPESS